MKKRVKGVKVKECVIDIWIATSVLLSPLIGTSLAAADGADAKSSNVKAARPFERWSDLRGNQEREQTPSPVEAANRAKKNAGNTGPRFERWKDLIKDQERDQASSPVDGSETSPDKQDERGRAGRTRNTPRVPPFAAKSFSGDWQEKWGEYKEYGDRVRDRVYRDYKKDLQKLNIAQWHEKRHVLASDRKRHANWKALKLWLRWISAPFYYEEGVGYYVPETLLTSPQYFSAYSYQDLVAPKEGDWLPLGLFVILSPRGSRISPNRYLELAVNAKGELSGYVYDASQDSTQEVVGSIDPRTQEAVWSIKDRSGSSVFSTGAFNLTQEETTVQMKTQDGSSRTLILVRLER